MKLFALLFVFGVAGTAVPSDLLEFNPPTLSLSGLGMTSFTVKMLLPPSDKTATTIAFQYAGFEFSLCTLQFTSLNYNTPVKVVLLPVATSTPAPPASSAPPIVAQICAPETTYTQTQQLYPVQLVYSMGSFCSSTGDPHYSDFSGSVFDSQLLGSFYAIKSTQLTIQEHHTKFYNKAQNIDMSVNKKVAIRFGKTAFVFTGTKDGIIATLLSASANTNEMAVTSLNTFNSAYRVNLGDGSSISITGRHHINTVITIATLANYAGATGLCFGQRTLAIEDPADNMFKGKCLIPAGVVDASVLTTCTSQNLNCPAPVPAPSPSTSVTPVTSTTTPNVIPTPSPSTSVTPVTSTTTSNVIAASSSKTSTFSSVPHTTSSSVTPTTSYVVPTTSAIIPSSSAIVPSSSASSIIPSSSIIVQSSTTSYEVPSPTIPASPTSYIVPTTSIIVSSSIAISSTSVYVVPTTSIIVPTTSDNIPTSSVIAASSSKIVTSSSIVVPTTSYVVPAPSSTTSSTIYIVLTSSVIVPPIVSSKSTPSSTTSSYIVPTSSVIVPPIVSSKSNVVPGSTSIVAHSTPLPQPTPSSSTPAPSSTPLPPGCTRITDPVRYDAGAVDNSTEPTYLPVSLDDATRICKALIDDHNIEGVSHAFYSQACIADYSVTGDINFADDARLSYNGHAENVLYQQQKSNDPIIAEKAATIAKTCGLGQNVPCPNGCGVNGECSPLGCMCLNGYGGNKCDQNLSQPQMIVASPSSGALSIGTFISLAVGAVLIVI